MGNLLTSTCPQKTPEPRLLSNPFVSVASQVRGASEELAWAGDLPQLGQELWAVLPTCWQKKDQRRSQQERCRASCWAAPSGSISGVWTVLKNAGQLACESACLHPLVLWGWHGPWLLRAQAAPCSVPYCTPAKTHRVACEILLILRSQYQGFSVAWRRDAGQQIVLPGNRRYCRSLPILLMDIWLLFHNGDAGGCVRSTGSFLGMDKELNIQERQ